MHSSRSILQTPLSANSLFPRTLVLWCFVGTLFVLNKYVLFYLTLGVAQMISLWLLWRHSTSKTLSSAHFSDSTRKHSAGTEM